MSTLDPEWQVVPAPAGRLYESARWIAEAETFQWVDILGHSVHRWHPGASEVESRVLDLEFVTMALPLDADRSIIASRSSLHEYRWSDGMLTTLGEWAFSSDVRFNDGAISPTGEIYVGTMSMDRRPDGGALMRFADGNLTMVVEGVGISNGLDWLTPSTACYVDSLVSGVYRLLLSDEPRRTTFAELADSEPDGLTVTPEGHVLVALWEGDRIAHLTGMGERLPDIPVPAHFPTSVAIGGVARDLIVVTTALEDPEKRTTDLDGRVLVGRWDAGKNPGTST